MDALWEQLRLTSSGRGIITDALKSGHPKALKPIIFFVLKPSRVFFLSSPWPIYIYIYTHTHGCHFIHYIWYIYIAYMHTHIYFQLPPKFRAGKWFVTKKCTQIQLNCYSFHCMCRKFPKNKKYSFVLDYYYYHCYY